MNGTYVSDFIFAKKLIRDGEVFSGVAGLESLLSAATHWKTLDWRVLKVIEIIL